MAESSTPVYEAETVIRNEYDFRRELLLALEEDFSSNNEVKDTEIYRQHILHALGQEFDQDDIKQTNNFRAKVVDGVKELVNGGGGGGNFRTAQVTFINASEGPSLYNLLVPTLNTEDLYIEVGHADFVPADDPHLRPTTIVLGTNGYYGTFDEFPSSAIATGGVRYDEGDVYITGDGTLTIS